MAVEHSCKHQHILLGQRSFEQCTMAAIKTSTNLEINVLMISGHRHAHTPWVKAAGLDMTLSVNSISEMSSCS